MPVWHKAARKWVADGRLVLLGVVQEQHAGRARLFAQWHRFDWPILHDPINLLQTPAVPIMVAIDEHGIVRAVGPKLEGFQADFLDRSFSDDVGDSSPPTARVPDLAGLRRQAEVRNDADTWRSLGDALVLWSRPVRIEKAIEAYRRALLLDPRNGSTLFRLGVCYRMRYESDRSNHDDFQKAVDSWTQALNTDPNQYIWRRRIQQYGPRLEKPYAFYDWVQQATEQIIARGEKPVSLVVEPYGSEIADKTRQFYRSAAKADNPDPEGRIFRDRTKLIDIEVTVVPHAVAAGQSARVHVTLRPQADRKAHWNNEAGPLRVWIDPPPGWRASTRLLTARSPAKPQSTEVRRLDFEIQAPKSPGRSATLTGYALYYVCAGTDGPCRFLRHDFTLDLARDKQPAPRSAGRPQ